jgi:predicted dehydrogenase/threonine dehydrogenase-like Zn-dependent dehydrogenase
VAGDRIVSNGHHADVVRLPKKLCCRIPDSVDDETAAFTVIASIGLQGIRLAKPTLGEAFVVTGAGLIGLLTVQLLRANGCRVLAIDIDEHKLDLARSFGAETCNPGIGDDPVTAGIAFSRGKGVDGVIITAATKSNDPVNQAARMCRKRGRIVIVGVTGLKLNRADFYEKELSFQVSCSYGPGRYELEYEDKGFDYPIGFVRWTEQRNFEAVLDMMAAGKIDVNPLISHRFPFEDAEKAYELIISGEQPYLGILLKYSENGFEKSQTIELIHKELTKIPSSKAVLGMIGAGNFTGQVLLPALANAEARLKTIASGSGVTGTHLGKKFGFEKSTTFSEEILHDPEINTVFIATRHNTHAPYVVKAMAAGKHVFVEKPLCLSVEELAEIKNCYAERAKEQYLMVGFNRRFAPLVTKMKELLVGRSQPLSLVYTVNAGYIPPDHWTQNPEVGGGRIIGEACHFIDLIRFLVGHKIENVEARMMGNAPGIAVREDKMTILLTFSDGSIGTVHYLANGSKRFPKERLEIFSEGRILVLDNFKRLKGYGWKGFRKMKLFRQDKGHRAEVAEFIHRISEGSEELIPWPELEEVTRATFAAVESARKY